MKIHNNNKKSTSSNNKKIVKEVESKDSIKESCEQLTSNTPKKTKKGKGQDSSTGIDVAITDLDLVLLKLNKFLDDNKDILVISDSSYKEFLKLKKGNKTVYTKIENTSFENHKFAIDNNSTIIIASITKLEEDTHDDQKDSNHEQSQKDDTMDKDTLISTITEVMTGVLKENNKEIYKYIDDKVHDLEVKIEVKLDKLDKRITIIEKKLDKLTEAVKELQAIAIKHNEVIVHKL